MKKVLLTATVQSHIAQFHLPLIEMLKQNGYEVHVAARNNLEEKNGLRLDTPSKIFDIPFNRSPLSINNIKAYRMLKKILNENKYDAVHCNTPMGGVITRLAAIETRRAGTKVFYTAHGFHFYKGAPLINWIVYYPVERLLAHVTDKLITITKEDYQLAKNKFKTEVCYIHGVGANSRRYFPYTREEIEKLRSELGYNINQFILICTGELNKNKNQSTVIKAVAEVKKEISNIKLLLAGNGPKEQELKDLVNKLNLRKVVDFLGYRTDLEKYINIADVVISVSYREGLPLNILEGMLCEKPVIASINRGHMELVQDQVTGYLFNPNDILSCSELIIKLEQNTSLIKTLGLAGRKRGQLFTSQSVVNELSEIYEMTK
ncbi:MAG: glycosyltransferase family 4 protein [Tissierellia bacterium]|nr:glycosyltransferase family 4 protein [Tissierellia bacterium]